LGVKQINAGFHHLFSLPVTYPVQLVLIIGITLIATVSVVLGLKAGVRRLSQLNMYFAFALLLFVLLAGPTLLLIRALIQNIGAYLCALPRLSLWTQAYDYQSAWMSQWTLFYWAWWIAWSPFVGMFIARISRGRTIREFLLGVLLVPSLVTFIWMTVFGNSAIAIDQAQTLNMVQAVREHIAVALFKLLSVFPLSQISSCLAVTVVTLFFVTSSDSASMVVDIITAGGNTDPPVWQRIFWAFLEGALAAVLLALGGIAALQMAAIIFGLPFSVIIMLMSFSLLKALRQTPPA
jgi:choline/glycine/proline betaine transport protein